MATVQNQKSYESWYESFEGQKEGKFMTWYHSYQGKKVVNIVYSLGASVVIIGALFKIMHFKGAGPVLMTGMITEAFLFMIGILEAPHEEFHWANVFPELLEYGSPEERIIRSREQKGLSPMPNAAGNAVAGNAAPASSGVAFSDKEMEAVKASMGDLAKAATQLSEIGKLATTSNKLGEQMEAATKATAQYVESASSLGAKSAEVGQAYSAIEANMKSAVEGSKAYEKEVSDMSKKLGALNSMYELQLAAAQTQVEAYKTQASEIASATQKIQAVGADFAKMEAAATETMKSQEAFDAAQKKLAQQVADLNKVYGNMLSALA